MVRGQVLGDQFQEQKTNSLNSSNSPLLKGGRGGSLPCLNSSSNCLELLGEAAIANSPELVTLTERINLIEQRLELMEEKIDYSEDKQWTNYITLDPLRLLQNIFGGGDVQRDRIAIADLEIQAADLEAAKAVLERQQEEVKVELGDKVLEFVLAYEEAQRKHSLLETQLVTFNQRWEMFRIQYRFGNGTTEQLWSLEQRGESLRNELADTAIEQEQAVRKLLQLTGLGLL